MNDFFLRVYLLSQLTRYRLAILRLIPGPSVHYSLIENPVVFPWYLRGLGGGVPGVPYCSSERIYFRLSGISYLERGRSV